MYTRSVPVCDGSCATQALAICSPTSSWWQYVLVSHSQTDREWFAHYYYYYMAAEYWHWNIEKE